MCARFLVPAISVLLLSAVLVAVLFVAFRSPLKDDIAWLLYVARRWMAGRELYVDVVEINPPLIVWISAVPIGLAGWLGIDVQFVAIPVFLTAVLVCAWWSAGLLRHNGDILANRVVVFALIGSVFLIVPAADVGQREHLLMAAFLPYLILFARRLEGGTSSGVALVVAGVLAGLGCALKPRYGAAFAALECLALMRGIRPWRPMPIAAGVTLLAYAGLVALLCPAYLRRAVPLALALYGATDAPFLSLLSDSAMLIFGQFVAVALLWMRRRVMAEFSLMLTLAVFAAVSTAVCFVDGKNWYYHQLPATITTILSLALWCVSEIPRWRQAVSRLPLVMAAVALAVFVFSTARRLEPAVKQAVRPQYTTQARLEEIIRTEHARTYIAFSEWIALGFPVVNETGVAWASRFDSMWALKGEVWRAAFDPAIAREWPIARWVAHDFIAGCPDIAVVDTRKINYIQILSAADPAFARAWSRYHRLEAFDGLAVYRRGKAGCLDVWVAAEARAERDLR